ncbi:MAG: metalloprotease PmbA, partial [Corallincola sp.]|nr:metalloprotease PmbA [Corallincola sp.]
MAVDHPMRAQLERYQQAIADALALATASGASAAEVAVSRQCGLSVSCRNDAIETLEHNNDGALGITVYIGQQKGSASTSELT